MRVFCPFAQIRIHARRRLRRHVAVATAPIVGGSVERPVDLCRPIPSNEKRNRFDVAQGWLAGGSKRLWTQERGPAETDT